MSATISLAIVESLTLKRIVRLSAVYLSEADFGDIERCSSSWDNEGCIWRYRGVMDGDAWEIHIHESVLDMDDDSALGGAT